MSQDGAEVQGNADAGQQELEQLRERMAVIKQAAAADVDKKWVSPFRTKELFDLKVKTRLSSNDEYRSLQGRVQAAEAKLGAGSGTAPKADTAQ